MGDLLSIEQAAEVLGVDYKTVYRLVRSGEIPAGRVGRIYRIQQADLEAYFENTKRTVAAESGRDLIPLAGLRCCVTGKRIVSELDIGGYASDTGEPICQAEWDRGRRTAEEAGRNADENGSTGEGIVRQRRPVI